MQTLNWRPDERVCRQFGFGGLAILGLLGAWVLWRSSLLGITLSSPTARGVASGLLVVGAGLGTLAVAAPLTLRWPFVGLSIVAFPIGWLVSHSLLAIMFFGVLAPAGLILRLLRVDPMSRRFDLSAGSYWVPSRPTLQAVRYFRQS